MMEPFWGKEFGDGEGLLTSVVGKVGETPTVAVSFQPTRVVGKNRWDFFASQGISTVDGSEIRLTIWDV